MITARKIAETFGTSLVAEGIEQEEELRLLRDQVTTQRELHIVELARDDRMLNPVAYRLRNDHRQVAPDPGAFPPLEAAFQSVRG